MSGRMPLLCFPRPSRALFSLPPRVFPPLKDGDVRRDCALGPGFARQQPQQPDAVLFFFANTAARRAGGRVFAGRQRAHGAVGVCSARHAAAGARTDRRGTQQRLRHATVRRRSRVRGCRATHPFFFFFFFSRRQESHLLNVVDKANGMLLRTYQVKMTVRYPIITKAFELRVPLHTHSNKRVSYTNTFPMCARVEAGAGRREEQRRGLGGEKGRAGPRPHPCLVPRPHTLGSERTFYFHTTRPDLISFKRKSMAIAAGEMGRIGMFSATRCCPRQQRPGPLCRLTGAPLAFLNRHQGACCAVCRPP